MAYNVIIPAGSGPVPDALAEATGASHKALLPIHGRPMLAYVLEALAASGCVQRVHVVGVSADAMAGHSPTGLDVRWHEAGDGLLENILIGMAGLDDGDPVLYCSADIPLLTPAAVQDLVRQAEADPAELCYTIVERSVMEQRFPGSGRSFRPLADGAFCGGDLSMVTPGIVRRNTDMGRALVSQRKSALGLLRLMGLGVLIRAVTGRLRIADLERRAGKVLGGRTRAVISPFAEIGMDVDRPAHLEVVLRAMEAEGDRRAG